MHTAVPAPTAQRKTQRRMAVETVLRDARRPLTADDIHRRARRVCPRLGIATVYRTLRLLQDAHRARQIAVPAHGVFYEQATARSHDHLYCDDCRHVHCVEGYRVTAVTPAARATRVHDRVLLLIGLCAACARLHHGCHDDP